MQSSSAVVARDEPVLAHHFASLEVQAHAARLGMWLFLATEILLFAGLFTCYAVYRYLFPEAFALGSRHLDLVMGTVNTLILISSSWTAAMAVHFARHGNNRMVALCFLATLAFALGFLVIKAFEYSHKFHELALPGPYYGMQDIQAPGIPLFFTVYFLSTGLHAFHVIIGMSVLTWLMFRALRGEFGPRKFVAVELGSMYWHLVDLIWIFLFPMLYLI